jgi:hypothetical protein
LIFSKIGYAKADVLRGSRGGFAAGLNYLRGEVLKVDELCSDAVVWEQVVLTAWNFFLI